MSKKGFSFIELLLVVVGLSVLIGSYAISTEGVSSASIDSISRKIQSDLRYAQTLAMNTGVKHGAIFLAGGGYEVYRDNPSDPVLDPVTREALIVDVTKYDGVSIASSKQIEFDLNGAPIATNDTRIQLNSEKGIVKNICIVQNTGIVILDFGACRE